MGNSVNISDELKELNSAILINVDRGNIYSFPDGYFNDLSANILRETWIQSLPKGNTYSVPTGYFESLSQLILDKLAVKSGFTNITSKELYSVPDGYFNNLSGNIFKKIKEKNNNVQQELEELSPLLSSIPKTNVYTVPEKYFESIVIQPKIDKQPAKVISIGTKTRKWFSYAAAACIAALMFGGYYYMQNNSTENNTASHNQIAGANIEQALLQLSDSEIDNYLQHDNTDVYTNLNSDNQDININTLLENMSDDEIDNYLINNPEPGEKTKRS